MKKLLLGSVALIALAAAGSAIAAEMPIKAPPPPPCIWCGFYIGGDIGGYGASQSATTTPYLSPGFGAPAIPGAGLAGFGQTPTTNGLNSSGILGGFYAGYNWQWTPSLVAGLEGDVTFLNRNASNTQVSSATFSGAPVPDFNMTVNASDHWLASARVRLGFTTGPALFYATGGAAWTNASYSATAIGFNNPPITGPLAGTTAATSWSGNRTGFAIGGGVDWMLPANPQWIFRAQYLYYQFARSSSAMGTLGNGVVVCAPGLCGWNVAASTLRISTGLVGVSYKFGGPGPGGY